MILTISIWSAIYLICFLLRKHLDFGTEKGYPYHWTFGFCFPILIWAIGAITGWLTSFEIGVYGFLGATVIGALKELVWDKLLGKGTCSLMDFIITASGAFCGTFFFVVPILNS